MGTGLAKARNVNKTGQCDRKEGRQGISRGQGLVLGRPRRLQDEVGFYSQCEDQPLDGSVRRET